MVKLFRALMLTVTMLPCFSCIKMPDFSSYQKEKEEEDLHPEPSVSPTLLSLSFMKEDNPCLEKDIVCNFTSVTDLCCVVESGLSMPCYLVPRFEVVGATLKYCGDEIHSGKDSIYCSATYPAVLKLEGSKKNVYKNVNFVPYTGLPVLEIYTNDNGAFLKDKETWVSAVMLTHGMGKFVDSKDDMYVKGRGNGTFYFPKKSFNVKLSSQHSVLGMPKHKRWCILANYRDRTLLRNEVAFQMGRMADGLEWTPNTEFAEVVINGKHQGVYQVTEKIAISENRINIPEITDSKDENTSGSYLMEIDSYYDGEYGFRTAINSWPVNIKSPSDDVIETSHIDYIYDWFNEMESLAANGEFRKLYEEYIDLDSFIDYLIVQTLTNNGEFGKLYSIYCYKKRNGKLFMGPLWDFEYSTFNKDSGYTNTTVFMYKYLYKDPVFVSKLKQRWAELRPVYEQTMPSFIEGWKQKLTVSAAIDENIIEKGQGGMKNGDEGLSFSAAVDTMTNHLLRRINYMDSFYRKL